MQQSLNQLSLAESYPVLRLTKPYKTVYKDRNNYTCSWVR